MPIKMHKTVNLTLQDLHTIISENAVDRSVYLIFHEGMRNFGNEIRSKHGEASRHVRFRLDSATYATEATFVEEEFRRKLAYKIAFTLPDEEVNWWALLNQDEKFFAIERESVSNTREMILEKAMNHQGLDPTTVESVQDSGPDHLH